MCIGGIRFDSSKYFAASGAIGTTFYDSSIIVTVLTSQNLWNVKREQSNLNVLPEKVTQRCIVKF